MTRLNETKKHLKKRTPKFTRSDSKGKARVARTSWRKPKGLQNKMGDNKKGFKKMPNEGYRTPRALRHTDAQGRNIKLVQSVADIASLTNKDVAIIASAIGNKKKMTILEALAKANVPVMGIKDAAAAAEKIKTDFAEAQKLRQSTKKERAANKEKKAKVKNEKDAKKEAIQKAQEEASKDDQKKELDKVLTQGDKA